MIIFIVTVCAIVFLEAPVFLFLVDHETQPVITCSKLTIRNTRTREERWTYFIPCSSVSIVNFDEEMPAGKATGILQNECHRWKSNCNKFNILRYLNKSLCTKNNNEGQQKKKTLIEGLFLLRKFTGNSQHFITNIEESQILKEISINPFAPNAPFLYLLKTSEKLKVF